MRSTHRLPTWGPLNQWEGWKLYFGSVVTNNNTLRKEIEIWLHTGLSDFGDDVHQPFFLGLCFGWTTGRVVMMVVVVVVRQSRPVVSISLTHTNFTVLRLLMSVHWTCLNYAPMSIVHVHPLLWRILGHSFVTRDKTHKLTNNWLV